MKYIQALKEQGYNLKTLPTDIKKAINLVLKSKDYNSKVEALDYITFNSIRNSQPVDERIEELHKLSLTDHSVEDNNGFNTPLSIDNVEEEFASGGNIATKEDNNKVRNWKVRFHLARGEHFMNWKVENPKTNEVNFYKPDEIQIEMFNCKLTNSPATANKIFMGKMDKSPIAWVVCEKYKVSKKIDPVNADERLTYNPRTAPNWFDTDGDNVDNYVFEKLITFGRGVYYETPDGKLFALGGMAEQEELPLFSYGGKVVPSRLMIPNVRGGWTKEKIIKYFKQYTSDTAGTPTLAKYISEFDNWQQFKEHIYYHGTTNYIERGLTPSMAFSERWAEQQGGGGYGDRYFGVSLTKRKRTAENFSGQRDGVTIYPVILKKDAKVIERTDLQDASDIEDIIVELYEQGVDAVWIGGGEEELVAVNPYAILLYKNGREYHSVFGGFKSIALTDEKIKEIYDNSLKIYEDFREANSQATTKEERKDLVNSIPRIQFETGGSSEQMAKGKKIDIPVVFKQTLGDYKIYIEEVKSTTGEVFYSGEVYLKDMILRIFPAVSSDLEELKKIMRKYIDQIKISANENLKDTIFIDGKAIKVSETIYKYVLGKSLIPEKKLQTDSLRHAIENTISAGDLSVGTTFTKYEDIDALRSEMLRILRNEEGENTYSVPYSWEEYSTIKTIAYHHLLKSKSEDKRNLAPTPEPTIQPTPELKKEEPNMENNQPTGSVSNWNEVPVRWKNVKATRPITFNINPYDKGLNSIVQKFLGDDALRPVMTAMNFGDSGVVTTDAHKLLHIHYKNSDFRGNYATANTLKALKSNRFAKAPTDLEQATEQIKEEKYPNWIAVIPKDNPFVYEVDIIKLYQYLNVAINYANKTTNQVAFRYDKGSAIGFNGKFFMQSLEAMMKIQKCTKVYLHLSLPSRAMLISYEKSISATGNTYVLLMPVMVNRDLDERGSNQKITQIFGTADIDLNKYLNCYFDFEDSQIHNGDGSIADYKESYGDAEELPLALITMLDKFIKISKNRLPILDNVCVDGNGIRVDNLDARIEVANDWKIPQGLYTIEKNAMVRNTLNSNIDDYPKLKSRVQTNDPAFTIDAEVFKYYIIKASEHNGDDDLRPMMKSILFQNDKGGLQIVSTDAHTLFHANVTKYASQIKNKDFIFPLANSKELINFAKNIDSKEVKFYADEDKNNYRIDGGRLHFEAKMSDGKYPNWEAVIPIRYSNQLMFDIKDLYVCMNNELAKAFAKTEELKPATITIFNQDDKIFMGNFPKQDDELTTKEICTLKIKKETFETERSFNSTSSNYIVLMPQTRTNGNYFNFAVDHLNSVISSIGKEKVIVNYSALERAYIFTSDNLDYKTSDVYKPVKAITTPVKASPVKPIKEKIQPSGSSTNFKTNKSGKLEPNASQLKMSNRPIPEMSEQIKNEVLFVEKQFGIDYKDKKYSTKWDIRYIEARRKLFPKTEMKEGLYGKPLSSFNVGDIVGTTARNYDGNRYVILEVSKDKAYLLPYDYANPTISDAKADQSHWELIEPKQSLLTTAQQKKEFNEFMFGNKFMKSKDKGAIKEYPVSTPVSKSGKNPSEFNVGDIIEYAGVTYEVKNPKTKDNFSLLINLSDTYRKGDIDEFANTEHTKVFKLVSKKSPNLSKVSVSKPVATMLGTGKVSPASAHIQSLNKLQAEFLSTNTKAERKSQIEALIKIYVGKLKNLQNDPEIKSSSAWEKSVKNAISSSELVLKSKPKEETKELEQAIKGLEVYLKNFGSVKEHSAFTEWQNLKVAIKGLKALLK